MSATLRHTALPVSFPVVIRGRVTEARQALLTVRIVDASGIAHPLEFQLDTGFNGWLTLPTNVIDRLGLIATAPQTVSLADGQRVELRTFVASALVDGQPHNVFVVESGGNPLFGMSMLWGSSVTIQAWEGGAVIIEEVAPRNQVS